LKQKLQPRKAAHGRHQKIDQIQGGHASLETGFRPAIYYIAITPTIQGFEIKKRKCWTTAKHAQEKRNEDNGETTKR
jgi:hypothetical protein